MTLASAGGSVPAEEEEEAWSGICLFRGTEWEGPSQVLASSCHYGPGSDSVCSERLGRCSHSLVLAGPPTSCVAMAESRPLSDMVLYLQRAEVRWEGLGGGPALGFKDENWRC
jgi:hypothetical protein